jgi:hypothetical protein
LRDAKNLDDMIYSMDYVKKSLSFDFFQKDLLIILSDLFEFIGEKDQAFEFITQSLIVDPESGDARLKFFNKYKKSFVMPII